MSDYLKTNELWEKWKEIIESNEPHASLRIGDVEPVVAAHNEIMTMKSIEKLYLWVRNKDVKYGGIILPDDNAREQLVESFRQADFLGILSQTFHFANEELKSFFNSRIKQDDLVYKEKNTKIYYNGKYIDYPFQKNIHQLPKKEFIDCLYDLFNKEEKDKYAGFEDMLYGKFGKSITNKFLKPYNEKLYACNLNDLDPDAMGRFFPYANIGEIIENMKFEKDTSYNRNFLYPKKGAMVFVNALLKEIKRQKVLYNQEVINIDIKNKIVQTKTDSFEYEYLINTSPFDQLI
jgi:protoporphyrinogen oxidase